MAAIAVESKSPGHIKSEIGRGRLLAGVRHQVADAAFGIRGSVHEDVATDGRWCWQVELVANPDPILSETDQIVVTADSAILDRCGGWFNLARITVSRYLPDARVVDFVGPEQSV